MKTIAIILLGLNLIYIHSNAASQPVEDLSRTLIDDVLSHIDDSDHTLNAFANDQSISNRQSIDTIAQMEAVKKIFTELYEIYHQHLDFQGKMKLFLLFPEMVKVAENVKDHQF